MIKRIAILLLLSGTAALAQSAVVCNAHGAVVTVDAKTVYYIGKDCDASQKGGGIGTWFLAASAMVVVIDGIYTRLPFEIDCDLPSCWTHD